MSTLWDAIEKYEGFREAAREFVFDELAQNVFVEDLAKLRDGLHFGPIDSYCRAKISAANWNFDWPQIVDHFQKDVNRFELAIWFEDDLCGLGIGRISNGPENVTVHFIERRNDHSALKGWIAQIVTDTAEAYAKILEKQLVKLKDPVADAIPTYERLGFSLAESSKTRTYYARRVGQ